MVTPEGNCTKSRWISLKIQVENIDYAMLNIDLCDKLIAMILGRDWQRKIQAKITIEPNSTECMGTPL